MNFLKNFFKLGIKEPFGCLFSLVISISLISLTIMSFAYIIFAIWAVSLIKNTVESSTGFQISADDISVNLFNGNCSISNLIVKNPDIYKKADDRNEVLMKVSKLDTKLSIWALCNSEFEIEYFSAVVDEINALRLNTYTGNFREFLTNLLEITSAKKIDEKPHLSEFNIVIKSASYKDKSLKSDIIYWSMDNEFSYHQLDVSDLSAFKKSFKSELINANAPFISNSISAATKK